MVVDLGSVMVHLMSPEARLEYGLEERWQASSVEDADSIGRLVKLKPRSQIQDPSRND